ncbi:MAG: ATP-binding protein [Candidatus Micrarchaeota archaeon]
MELGTVVTTEDSPATGHFSFVASSPGVRKGRHVQLQSDEGLLLAVVQEITRGNRYFERAESVNEYEKHSAQNSFLESFPAKEWEYAVARCRILGAFKEGQLKRSSYPPAPGTKVQDADDELLTQFFGFKPDGLLLGKMFHHDVEVRPQVSRLLQKHLAVLAMSGAGKSYAMACLIEELLDRPKEKGRLAVAVFDVHGEYSCFADRRANPDYADKSLVVKGDKIRISAAHLTPQLISELVPEVSKAQLRDLSPILHSLKEKRRQSGEPFGLQEVVSAVESSDMNKNSKDALMAWLGELRQMRIVGKHDQPSLKQALKPGRLAVFDFSMLVNQRQKQAIVSYLSRKMFRLRRREEIPPYLCIVEEAHNFAPEHTERGQAVSRAAIETVAREGRKFGASLCLVSQRPVHLSTTALSQCNTQLILRITNPYDLKHIQESCEAVDADAAGAITMLKTGEGILLGEAVSQPVFVGIRARKSRKSRTGEGLDDLARRFEEQQSIAEAVSDVEAGEAFL